LKLIEIFDEPTLFKLGVVYKNGRIINHRSVLKVFCNPLLRLFGICIATKLNNGELGGVTVRRSKVTIQTSILYNADYDYIMKERILF
jgi:hypothetical protein